MSTKQQLQQPQSSDMKKNDNNKTYIWIKLHNGQFIPDGSDDNNKAVRGRKRGAPTSYNGSNGNNDDELWGWSPGYYSLITDTNNTDNTVSSTATTDEDQQANTAIAQYQITLLNSNNNQEQTSNNTHIISQQITNKLLSNGSIVLANSWEEHDFINRLQTSSGDGESDDESYNYDEESSDSDEDTKKSLHHLIEEQVVDSPPSNLVELTHLHEPSVVHALRYRYENTSSCAAQSSSSGGQGGEGESNMANNIYTDTGPILLAVNPFKHDKSGRLYGNDTVDRYRSLGEKSWLKERGGTSSTLASFEEKEAREIDDAIDEGETSLPPHVYAVADRTFRTMMTRLHPATDISSSSKAAPQSSAQDGKSSQQQQQVKINQSVLVSGESGAGKTVTTKLLMSYLSKLSEKKTNPTSQNSSQGDDDSFKEESTMSKRILESNPIMESFGNARTIRNDNSSRFGKYIEMKFVSGSSSKSSKDEKDQSTVSVPGATLVGASIETYLLEKVRLVHQSAGERNYHIFYELFSMKYEDDNSVEEGTDTDTNEQMAEKLGLLNYDMEDFRLINTSDTYDRRDGVLDSDTFNDMKQAMTIMGFTCTEIHSVFQVTTALLHASNLSFERVGEVECALKQDDAHLDYVVDLLGITKEGLNSALCYYEITIGGTGRKGGETHKRVLSMEQCEKGVEALIKATYGSLFNYLVKRINASVAGDVARDSATGGKVSRTRRGTEKEASIGILVSRLMFIHNSCLLSSNTIPAHLLILTPTTLYFPLSNRISSALRASKSIRSNNYVSTIAMRHYSNSSIDSYSVTSKKNMIEKAYLGVL